MFAKSGRSTPIANSNGTNGSANMAPSVAAPGARPWLQKRQTQGHPNIINNNSNININGVTNAAAGPAVPVNTALAVQHTALVFNPGPSSGVSEVVQSRPVRRPLPQRNAPPATTSITAATTLANTNANINTSPTVSLVSAPNVAGIIPGAQRPNFPLRTRSSSNTNGNLNGKAQPLQRPTVQQMAYYSQFPQQQQQQPQQNLQQPSIQQQSLQQPVHQLLPPPSKQLYPLQMQQQLLSPPPQLQQPQQASPREQRPYHSPRPLTPSTPHYSRQQQQQQQDKLDRLMNEAQLDAQTNHATSPTPTQTSPLTVAASAGVSTTAGMPSSMIFVSLPQAPLVSSTGHQRQPSQGSITIPRVSSVTRNASNSSNSSRRSRITSVRAAGSTDLNAPNTSPSTISGTTPIPSFKSQRSSRLTLPISEKTLDVTSNDGSFSLESLKAFNARIEALESLNESLKLELSHKEKRIDAITAHTKETDRRLDQAQHDLRESDSKLRKLRGDRGSVISEVSLNSSKRVKSLRQGLADLEMLRQTEADQLRGFFSKEMKSKDSEIQRLTDALQAQLRAKAALSAVTNGAVASVGSAITGVIGGTAADDFAISVLLKQMELQKLKVADLEQKLAIYSPDANSTTIENGVETKQVLERRIQSLESQHSLEIDAITSEMEQLRVELDDVLKAYEDVELKREAEVARYESDKKELERLGQLEISDWKEKYKTMMNTFAKEKESLRAELTKMAAEVESTKRTHEKMLSEVSEKHAVQLNDVKTQMSQTFHQRNINSILGSVNEQLEQLMTEKTLVEASLVSCTQERDDSLKKLQEAGKTIETLTAHQKALEDGFATKIGNLVEKNKTLKEAKIDSDSQATMANSKFAALFSQFEALKADKLAENDRFKQELERLEKSRTALEMELNSSGHEFDDLIEKLRLAESAKAILEKDVEILNLQIEKLQSTSGTKISFEDESFLDSLATDKLRQDLLDTREKVAEAESKNLKLQHEISSLKAEIFKTSEDTQDKERLHSDLKLDLNEARKEIDRLKVTLNDAESSLQKQRLSLNEENRSKYIIKELEAEISSLQESLNNALIDLKDVNEYADECEREISQLKLGISQSPPSSTNSRSNRKSISGTENNVELVELRLKLQDVQNQLSESDEKINILEKNKSHLSSLFKEFQSKANLGVTEAKQQLDEAKITIEELMKKIASLEEENENLRNRHDRIQSQLDSKNIPTMQEVLNLEQQVSSLANQLRENESQKDLANNSRIDTEHVVEELKSQVASLESLLATNQVETIKLQQELVLHNGKDISKLQEQIETLQSSNMDLQSQLEQLSKINIPSKSNDNAELLDEIEFLKLENGGLLDQYNALLAQTPQESTQKIQELEDEVYHITKQAEDYLSELEALDGQIELLQSTLEASKKNQKELEEKYSEQNLTVLQLKEELEAAKIMKENELSNIEIQQDTGIDVDVLSNEIASLKDEKASLLLKIDALKKDFSNFETRESELQHEKQDLESYLIQFKSELQICQETLILSSNDTSIIKQEREELRQKIEQLTSEIRYIQEQNEGMKVELMKQLEGVDILESRVFDLEATAKISAENVSLLEAENKALLEEIKASTIQSNNDSDDRLRIKAENSALINETKAAQYQIADHLAKIEDFRNRQSILEAENKKLLEEVKVAQHQITEQLQKISNLNKLVDERNDLEAKNFSLVEELKTAHEQIAAHLIEIGNGPSNFALQEEIAGYLAKLAEFDKLAENHDRLESENARLAEDLSNLLKTSPLEATANSLEDVYSEKQESLSVRSDISNIKDLLKEQIDNLVIANEELSRQLKESDEKILEMRDQITVMKAVAEGGETPNDMQIMVQKTFQQVAELSDERDSLQEQNEMLTQKVEELQKKIRPSSGESTPKKKGYFF